MNKKDYILKLLDALQPYWPLARGLKILVTGNALDDQTIDALMDMFTKNIETINDAVAKEKLSTSKDFLEKLKQVEREQHVKDEADLKELDEMLKTI